MPGYVARIVDEEVRLDLSALGAVAIEGPKACGKTETARQHSASEILLDQNPEELEAAKVDPRLILPGPTPRLIDEWQLVPSTWNAVRRAVDDRRGPGQFILTGSTRPVDDARRHSGAGRFARIRLRPMTLLERQRSSGVVSIGRLLDGQDLDPARSDLSVVDYAAEVVIGGWPVLMNADEATAARVNRGYLDTIAEAEIDHVDGAHRDPIRVRRFLQAFAQLVAHPAKLATIVAGAVGEETDAPGSGPSRWAVADYIAALTRLMLIEDQPAWQPNVRSRTRFVSIPKRHLADPSLAAAALQRDRDGLLADLNTLGFLYESLVVRDLRVYAQANNASVFHYREEKGALEVDAIIERADGSWVACEVQLGTHAVDDAAAALKRLAARTVRPPAALVVITTGQFTYMRDDGVAVAPAGTLGP